MILQHFFSIRLAENKRLIERIKTNQPIDISTEFVKITDQLCSFFCSMHVKLVKKGLNTTVINWSRHKERFVDELLPKVEKYNAFNRAGLTFCQEDHTDLIKSIENFGQKLIFKDSFQTCAPDVSLEIKLTIDLVKKRSSQKLYQVWLVKYALQRILL